jgi:ubiquinone/menaquinone biosynthesis C-methylase UbiE
MKSLSFDGLVNLYDETRSFDSHCLDSALNYISTKFPINTYSTLFEPGIGTGRIAIPFAQLGYQVVGVDISDEMLSGLRKRLDQCIPKLPITFQRADINQLPFINSAFDIAIVSHVFYFIQDWKKAVDEILRVIRKNGSIILLHTGNGAEIPFLNERYKDLCASLNNPIPTMGVKGTKEVVDYFCSLGCKAEWIRDRWQWTTHIQLSKALDYIKHQAYSFTIFAPDPIHREVIEKLETELKSKYNSLDKIIEIPNQIYLVVLDRP